METLIPIAVWAAIIIAALGVLAIIIFGIRGVMYGKVEPLSIGLVAIAAVVFVVLGLIMPSWAMAAIWTVVIMFGLALVALFASGVRGFFT